MGNWGSKLLEVINTPFSNRRQGPPWGVREFVVVRHIWLSLSLILPPQEACWAIPQGASIFIVIGVLVQARWRRSRCWGWEPLASLWFLSFRSMTRTYIDSGFQDLFLGIFLPRFFLGEMIPNLRNMFSKWVGWNQQLVEDDSFFCEIKNKGQGPYAPSN